MLANTFSGGVNETGGLGVMGVARRALTIGINDYPGVGSDLVGCLNDANDWAAVLAGRGFRVDSIIDSAASRNAILESIHDVVAQAVPGDVVVVTYSGHGTWVPDEDSDEADSRDEAICPHDVTSAGPIIDDELCELFAQCPSDARAILISDSCHSGTLQRFAPALGGAGSRVRFLPPAAFIQDEGRLGRARRSQQAAPTTTQRSALLLAGCQDAEYSYDAVFDGRPNGAFTYVALRALDQLPENATYHDWMGQIRKSLPSMDHPQTPQLDGLSYQREWPVFS